MLNQLGSSLKGIWTALLLLIRSRKFLLAVAAIATIWSTDLPAEVKVGETVKAILVLVGAIAVEDAALKMGGKAPTGQ